MRRALLFGKLPAHGDFVARGLEPAERDDLDRWLSATMLDAQEGHGAAFADRFDQAPPWRFARRWGDGWAAGAIIPSVDGAGRRFPLVAGIAGLLDYETAPAAEAVEALLYRVLPERWHADAVVDALDAMATGTTAAIPRAGWWTLGGGADGGLGFAASHLDGERPERLVRSMLTDQQA